MKLMSRPEPMSGSIWANDWHISRELLADRPVVEDEPLLRMLAVEVVEEAAFVAIEAWDADEAVVSLDRARISVCFSLTYQHARQHGGAETGPRSARPLPPSRYRWFQVSAVSAPRSPVEQLFVGKPYQASALVEELHSLVGFSSSVATISRR
jgi:two-component system, response regulator PdtaR